jgi:septal ring factor EnvC (AmiA/AmiB activator)
MTDTDKILQKLEEQGRKIDEQGKQLAQLQTDVSGMKSDVGVLKTDVAAVKGEVTKIPGMQQQLGNLELNIEAFRAEQQRANEELLSHIITSNDANGEVQQALEKRVDRIEKNLNLPSVK